MQLYETSDHSTHLGSLFVADINVELSNMMLSYRTDQKVFLIKTFYFSGGSCVIHVAPLRDYLLDC
jgi:hypothetical protein